MAEAKLPDRGGRLAVLPRYRSHKEIWALEIASVKINADGSATLDFVEPFAAHTVASKVVHRYMPITGDRFIVYEDGYTSISPRAAFENGYSRAD